MRAGAAIQNPKQIGQNNTDQPSQSRTGAMILLSLMRQAMTPTAAEQ